MPVACVFGRHLLNIAVRRRRGAQQVTETDAEKQETQNGDEAKQHRLASTMTGELVGINGDFWATIEVKVLHYRSAFVGVVFPSVQNKCPQERSGGSKRYCV